MTQEHVTITEEVQKDGQVVNETRETLQTTPGIDEARLAQPAMSTDHPDYASAQDRVYVYDPEIGASRSYPREPEIEEDEANGPHELTVAELKAYADAHNIDLGDATRKAEIKETILDSMTVSQLRDFAELEGTDLGGATRKDDIKELVLAGPQNEDDEDDDEEPKPTESVGNPVDSGGQAQYLDTPKDELPAAIEAARNENLEATEDFNTNPTRQPFNPAAEE